MLIKKLLFLKLSKIKEEKSGELSLLFIYLFIYFNSSSLEV